MQVDTHNGLCQFKPNVFMRVLLFYPYAKMQGYHLLLKKYSEKISYYRTTPRRKSCEKLTVTAELIMLSSLAAEIKSEVNPVNVRHAALSKVHSILSKCPPGPVRLVIGRHPNPKVKYLTLSWVWEDSCLSSSSGTCSYDHADADKTIHPAGTESACGHPVTKVTDNTWEMNY